MTKTAEYQFETPLRERPATPWWEGGRLCEAMAFGHAKDFQAKAYVGVGSMWSNGISEPWTVGLNALEFGHGSAKLTPAEARRVASFLLQAADWCEAENIADALSESQK